MVNGKLFDPISVDKATFEDVFSEVYVPPTRNYIKSYAFFSQSNYPFRMIITANSD
jgi:hypothetical protein